MSIKYFSKLSPFMVNTLPKLNSLSCKSQELMLDYGYIQASGATGFYNILPLGQRVLDKLCAMIETTMEERIGAFKLSLSSLTSTDLWKQSGRLESAWGDLFAFKDRNDKQICLNPTHEESICSMLVHLLGTNPSFSSPKQLPLCLYQIGRKYRDEGKPKHGLLRAREFLMADAYGFHPDYESAQITYNLVRSAYLELLENILDEVIISRPVQTSSLINPSSLMGEGTYGLSHEYHAISSIGEDIIALCPKCSITFGVNSHSISHIKETAAVHPNNITKSKVSLMNGGDQRNASYHHFSPNNAPMDTLKCPSCNHTGQAVKVTKPKKILNNSNEISTTIPFQVFNTIEVAHTFHLGTHFARAFNLTLALDQSRPPVPCHMTCYGIGVTRLMAAILETSGDRDSDEGRFCKWPPALAPFRLAVVPPKSGSKEEKAVYSNATTRYYADNMGGFVGPTLLTSFPRELKGEILCDDRTHLTVGKRVGDMKRIGIPLIVVCGRKLLEDPPKFEFYNGHNDTTSYLVESDLINAVGKSLRELFCPI